jgi:HlyD family secretion protein
MKFHAAAIVMLLLYGCSNNQKGEILASGTIEGTEINISAEVAGKVKEVRVEEGSTVHKFDTLALLNHQTADIELRQAEANLAASEAQYRLLARGSRREDIIQAEANFKNAQQELQRMTNLLQGGTVTQKQVDDAQTHYVVSQQALEKLKSGALPEELQAAIARRDQAAAQADLIRKRIRDSFIISPAQGIVTLKSIEVGEYVNVAANLFRIVDLGKVKLMIYPNETEVGKIKLGATAKVTIDANPGKEYEGAVTFISPVAEFTPKNVQTKEERTKLVFGVKIEVQNPEGALKPGLPADAKIIVE